MIEKILDEIIENYKFYYTIAYRHLKNHEDACDAVQNVCMKITARCPENLSAKKIRSWIAVTCCNESKNILAAKKRASLSDMSLIRSEEPVSDFGNPQDLEFYYEDITYAAIKTAPEKYQKALYAYYKNSISLLLAAAQYDVPESNLRYWKKKVEKKLKEFL